MIPKILEAALSHPKPLKETWFQPFLARKSWFFVAQLKAEHAYDTLEREFSDLSASSSSSKPYAKQKSNKKSKRKETKKKLEQKEKFSEKLDRAKAALVKASEDVRNYETTFGETLKWGKEHGFLAEDLDLDAYHKSITHNLLHSLHKSFQAHQAGTKFCSFYTLDEESYIRKYLAMAAVADTAPILLPVLEQKKESAPVQPLCEEAPQTREAQEFQLFCEHEDFMASHLFDEWEYARNPTPHNAQASDGNTNFISLDQLSEVRPSPVSSSTAKAKPHQAKPSLRK